MRWLRWKVLRLLCSWRGIVATLVGCVAATFVLSLVWQSYFHTGTGAHNKFRSFSFRSYSHRDVPNLNGLGDSNSVKNDQPSIGETTASWLLLPPFQDSDVWLHIVFKNQKDAQKLVQSFHQCMQPPHDNMRVHLNIYMTNDINPPASNHHFLPRNYLYGKIEVYPIVRLLFFLSCGEAVSAKPGPQHARKVFHHINNLKPKCAKSIPHNHFLFLPGTNRPCPTESIRNNVWMGHELKALTKLVDHFFFKSSLLDTILGLSLSNPSFEKRLLQYTPLYPEMHSKYVFYTLQHSQAVGGLYFLPNLATYVRWFEARCQVLPFPCLPENPDHEDSYPDFFNSGLAALFNLEVGVYHMMTEMSQTMIYPPFAMNDTIFHAQMDSFSLPVFFEKLNTHLKEATLSELAVYNARRSYLHNEPHRLFARDTELFDRCTMIITVYDRYKDIVNRLLFYHSSMNLRNIIIVWNAVSIPPPDIPDQHFRIPILVVPQTRNSMNNRFYPPQNIASISDCIVNMDDDWNMPHQLLFHSVSLWYHLHQDRLVGLLKLARLHARQADGSWIYLKNDTAPQSIVLPSGMVYHQKYMHKYSYELPSYLRKHVDTVVNCDDLLFNFLVANATSKPPIFVQSQGIRRVRVIQQLGKDQGLWRRSKHYLDRDECLNIFAKAFGGMPMKYSGMSYHVDDSLLNAFPQPINPEQSILDNVQCTKCNSKGSVDDCVTCSTHLP
eukprot:gene4131-65_t